MSRSHRAELLYGCVYRYIKCPRYIVNNAAAAAAAPAPPTYIQLLHMAYALAHAFAAALVVQQHQLKVRKQCSCQASPTGGAAEACCAAKAPVGTRAVHAMARVHPAPTRFAQPRCNDPLHQGQERVQNTAIRMFASPPQRPSSHE